MNDYIAHRVKNGGTIVATGLKVGHCVTDSTRWDAGVNPNRAYNCSNQGIQMGWADIYGSSLDGQWVDVTGLPGGTYTLELEINPLRILKESNYSNNIVQATVNIIDGTNVNLPAPIYFEEFNSVAEGALPSGWSVTNFTTSQNPGFNLTDPLSDTYKNFVVISSNRLATFFG